MDAKCITVLRRCLNSVQIEQTRQMFTKCSNSPHSSLWKLQLPLRKQGNVFRGAVILFRMGNDCCNIQRTTKSFDGIQQADIETSALRSKTGCEVGVKKHFFIRDIKYHQTMSSIHRSWEVGNGVVQEKGRNSWWSFPASKNYPCDRNQYLGGIVAS